MKIKKLLSKFRSSKEKKKDLLQVEAEILGQRLKELCKNWPAQEEAAN